MMASNVLSPCTCRWSGFLPSPGINPGLLASGRAAQERTDHACCERAGFEDRGRIFLSPRGPGFSLTQCWEPEVAVALLPRSAEVEDGRPSSPGPPRRRLTGWRRRPVVVLAAAATAMAVALGLVFSAAFSVSHPVAIVDKAAAGA